MSTNEYTKNVLLLAMSTLPKTLSPNVYYYERENGEHYYFQGISQLESETKLVISKLAETGEKLDRIVCLCSEEACKNARKDAKGQDISAQEFFEKRMISFLKREAPSVEDPFQLYPNMKEKKYIEEHPETTLSNNVLYDNFDSLFSIIKMEKENFFWDAVKKIKMEEEKPSKIHLYLNMQGGDRNAVAQMNAIVELLKNQNVEIKGRYANDYEPKKYLHKSMEVSKQYDTYRFVTAMQVFRNYGWGDDLIAYFEEKGEEIGEDHHQLIRAIKKASDGMRLCNMDQFDDALKSIKSLTSKENKEGKESLISIVLDEIREDYGSLLEDSSPVNKIRWCEKKGFLQQALTIIESQMPKVLNNLVSIECEELDSSGISLEDAIKFDRDKNKNFSWMSYENYKFAIWSDRGLEVKRNGDEWFPELEKDEKETWKKTREDILHELQVTFKDVTVKNKAKLIISLEAQYKEKEKLFGYFLLLHYGLKKQRNEVNHSVSGKRISIENIRSAIQLYLSLERELFGN